MLHTILQPQAKQLFAEVQSHLEGALDFVSRSETPLDQRDALASSAARLDLPFLLVIVGEFNSGKSSFLNALLGLDLLEQGVTPTTSRIHVLRYGESVSLTEGDGGVVRVEAPLDILREIELVDTPGTNAIDRSHEALTRDFVPRSDLVLFVTSADRPFTESEREFLDGIREWGKKTVLAVNKVDILETDDQRDEVVAFVRKHSAELLGSEAHIFPLSARQALREREAGMPDTSGLSALESWIRGVLDEDERLRLKLVNPLGVAQRILKEQKEICGSELEEMNEDGSTLEQLEAQSHIYSEDLRREFGFRLGDVDKGLHQLENRGATFFDEVLRLGRLPDLLNKAKIRTRFEQEVVADMPAQVEAQISNIIDWMVDRELRQWHELQELVGRRLSQHKGPSRLPGPQESSRKQLLATLGKSAQDAISGFDRSRESSRLAESVKLSLAGAAALEVGAVGLGAAVTAAATTTVVDVTGILAAGALAALGMFVLPARRRQAKRDLKMRLESLRRDLMEGVTNEFDRELERSVHRLAEAAGPYRRFVRGRIEVLEARREELGSLIDTSTGLDARVRSWSRSP